MTDSASDTAVAVLLDCSGSMTGILPEMKAGLLAAYQSADEAGEEMAVWSFSDSFKLVVPFGARLSARNAGLDSLRVSFGTTLLAPLRAVRTALLARPATRRLLVVIYDGMSRDSLAAAKEIAEMRSQSGIEVLGVLVGKPDAYERELARQVFPDLTEAADASALAGIFADLF